MSKSDAGKGDRPRKVDRKKWDEAPLWNNMRSKKKKQVKK